jgi:hypothetical protein
MEGGTKTTCEIIQGQDPLPFRSKLAQYLDALDAAGYTYEIHFSTRDKPGRGLFQALIVSRHAGVTEQAVPVPE